MKNLISKTRTFIQGESGTTSVEYAVMLFLIVATCIAAITAVGGQNGSIWGENSTEIQNAMN
jgi:Flp pilus assembly pilin Flp